MGYELGPGFLRRPPDDWLPARSFPLEHRAWEEGSPGIHGGSEVVTAGIQVRWRVQIPGREAYEFAEQRRGPGWVLRNTRHGNRWYKVKLRANKGLLAEVGVPCYVDPGNREAIWVDWDRAYEEHVEAWKREERVSREASRREGGLARFVGMVDNPLAGSLRPEEEALVAQRVAARKAEQAREDARVAAEMKTPDMLEREAHYAEMERVRADGVPARATVVANEQPGRSLSGVPVVHLTLDVLDGPSPRRVVHEFVWGPRQAKRYKPGRTIEIRVDPGDPDRIALMER